MPTADPCPQCHRATPIVLRGADAFCTACGARRAPFTRDIVNLAGTPARVGGIAARVLGWGAMGVGLFVALTVGLVVQAIASMFSAATWLGYAVGGPIALLAIVLGLAGILGGRKLGQVADATLFETQRRAVHALAQHQRGIVTARDASRALDLDEARADAVLGALAREPSENVSVDVSDEGTLQYLFGSADAIRWRIRAEQAGITDADRDALERELADPTTAPADLRPRGTSSGG